MPIPIAAAIYAFCDYTIPKKMKYGVCAIPHELLFFLFNSHPYDCPTQIAMIEVQPCDAPLLKHRSYLNTASLIPYEQQQVDRAVNSGQCWQISQGLRDIVKQKVVFHEQLAQVYESFILGNF